MKKNCSRSVLFIVVLIFGLTKSILAQTYQSEADQVMQPLNKSDVTTGILYDRVFPLAYLQGYKGISTDDTTNSDHFHQAYYELYHSMLNNSGYVSPETFNNNLVLNSSAFEHSIGVLNFNYNYLDTNAIRNNQLYNSNNQLYDDPNRTSSPYIQDNVFIATPLFPAETILESGEHGFSFDASTILTNTSFNIEKIIINFDDGYGNQELYPSGSSLRSSETMGITSVFRAIGHFFQKKIFIVRLTVVLFDGRQFGSVSKVVVEEEPETLIAGCNGGNQIPIAGIPFNGSAYGRGVESAEGTGYVFFANQNCATQTLTKPIIFLDGFDPGNKRSVQQIYDEYINKPVLVGGQQVNLGTKLRADGYDIIVFDYKDGGDLIEKNGLALVSLLQQLYAQHGSTMQSDFVIIGPSMGALVAQYGLAYAETNNIPTHTRLYISFDGPHQGANVPIGLQQLIDYFFQKGVVGSIFKDLKNGLHRVPSAKQMVVHNSTSNSETPAPDNFRNIFLANLQSVNTYPNPTHNPGGMRKIAIINGSNNLNPNQFVYPGSELMHLRLKRSGLLAVMNVRLGDRINLNVAASPSSARSETADMWLFSPLLNLLLWRDARDIKYAQPAPTNSSYDAAIGSYFADPITGEGLANLNEKLYLIGGKRTTFRKNMNNTFIPTTSAMDLQVPNFTLAYDFSNENIVCTGKTPFDRVYAPTISEIHVEITSGNAGWFENEIKGIQTPQPGGLGYVSISGPDNFCTSGYYSISNLPSGAVVTWSATGSISVPANSTGNSVTATANGSGSGVLTASVTFPCGSFTVLKQIDTGTPKPGPISWTYNAPPNRTHLFVDPVAGATQYMWYVNGVLKATTSVEYANINNSGTISCGNSYYFDVKATGPCGTSEESYVYAEIPPCEGYYQVWPNPSSSVMTVSYKDGEKGSEYIQKEKKYFSIRLYDNKSRMLRSGTNNSSDNTFAMDIQDIPDGTYFLHIIEGKKVEKRQIIIQH